MSDSHDVRDPNCSDTKLAGWRSQRRFIRCVMPRRPDRVTTTACRRCANGYGYKWCTPVPGVHVREDTDG